MKKTSTVLILLALILLFGLGFFFIKSQATHNQVETPAPTPTPEPTSLAKIECHSNNFFTVITKDNEDETGSSILVKVKKSPSDTIACEYIVSPSDFELKGLEAEYFLGLTQHHLLTDIGTGPEPRGLAIYSISSEKKVYSDSYARPIEITDSKVIYWSPTKITATKTNCPDLEMNTKNQLGSLIESHIVLDLTTMSTTSTKELRCKATQ